jgi:hypothetical protein
MFQHNMIGFWQERRLILKIRHVYEILVWNMWRSYVSSCIFVKNNIEKMWRQEWWFIGRWEFFAICWRPILIIRAWWWTSHFRVIRCWIGMKHKSESIIHMTELTVLFCWTWTLVARQNRIRCKCFHNLEIALFHCYCIVTTIMSIIYRWLKCSESNVLQESKR